MVLFWGFCSLLSLYFILRLNWSTTDHFVRDFFSGAGKLSMVILLMTALLFSVCNFLMCFADRYEYQQETLHAEEN
jgi:hypothetical protein